MNPVIGDVVIVRRLKVDQTGDDNDPAIVNVVRLVANQRDETGRYRGLPDVGSNDPRMVRNAAGEAQPGNYPYGGDVPAGSQLNADGTTVEPPAVPSGLTPTATEQERIARQANSVQPPSGVSPAEDAQNQARYAESVARETGELPPLKEGESRPDPTPALKPVAPHAFISATVFSENGRTRFVRNVPFFESPEVADLWPKPPVTPSNVDAGLVAYPKASAEQGISNSPAPVYR